MFLTWNGNQSCEIRIGIGARALERAAKQGGISFPTNEAG
jgi:hypothetical protein